MEAPAVQAFPVEALFVVPKKIFKRSPDRNKLKRRMKEAWRLKKHTVYDALKEKQIVAGFIYTSRKAESFDIINRSIEKLMRELH
jgi:ribonuclease P protein component